MRLDELGLAVALADYRRHAQTADQRNQILQSDELLPQYSEYPLLGNET